MTLKGRDSISLIPGLGQVINKICTWPLLSEVSVLCHDYYKTFPKTSISAEYLYFLPMTN